MRGSSESALHCLRWLCNVSPESSTRFSVTVVAAHPDDETIGAAARLSKLRRVRILFITDGSPSNMRDALTAGFRSAAEYAHTRYCEALSALSCCGISPPQVASLRVPDQAAARNLVSLSRSTAMILARFRADVVLTHAYEGGHPDHDAAAFCVHSASQLLQHANLGNPAIIEFTSYHAQGEGIATGEFLPNGGDTVQTLRLSPQEQELKREMFARYATQSHVLAQFPVSNESFRPAPRYDFTRLPDAPIYYDRFDWGLRSAEWSPLVVRAMHQLNQCERTPSLS